MTMQYSSERWLLPFFAAIRTRPGMFLGDERVASLSTFVAGYTQGRADLGFVGMHDDDEALLSKFDAWLEERTASHGPRGTFRWPKLVHRIDDGPRNVVTFFQLFTEFLEAEGHSWSDVPTWVPTGWQPDPASVKKAEK